MGIYILALVAVSSIAKVLAQLIVSVMILNMRDVKPQKRINAVIKIFRR